MSRIMILSVNQIISKAIAIITRGRPQPVLKAVIFFTSELNTNENM
jgi:hypothetical protein